MSDSYEFVSCPNCRERNPPARVRCWLCDASLEGLEPEVRAEAGTPVAPAPEPHFLSTSIVMTIAVLLVILGTMILVPGIGIVLACVLCVPFVRTALVSKRRAERGYEDAFPTTISMFLGSIGVTFVILTVVGVTAFGTFCLACFGTYATTESIEVAVLVSGVLSLALIIPLCWSCWKWARRRWKRDVGETRK